MHTLKLVPIGDAVGLVLPKEVLEKLEWEKGDTLFLTETAQGLMLSAHDPVMQDQLEAGHEFIGDYRDTLQALAG